MRFRRILTIPLIIAFVVLMAVLLPVTQLNDTAANPRFYQDRLQRADVYTFLYDELLPTGLDELEDEELSDSPIVLSHIKDDLVSAARRILPPDWLQAQVDSSIDAVLPYVVGDTDDFTLTVKLKDRLEAAAGVIIEDIVRGGVFAQVREDVISYLAEKLVENQDELPYSLSLSQAEIESTLRSVLPEDWMGAQMEAAIRAMVPYLTRDTDHFTITVSVFDLIDAGAAAAIDLLSRQETYDFLLDELVAPTIESAVGTAVDLGYGITISQEEVRAAIEEVLPPDWLQARLSQMIGGIAAYAKGDAETFEIAVDLGDRKAVALEVLTGMADDKLMALFDSLPECSMPSFLQAIQNLPAGTLPPCRPSGVSYQEAKDLLGIDISAEIDRAIGGRLPGSWTYTEADLRLLLSAQEAESFLDDARKWAAEGWTFTDSDLLSELDSDEVSALEDARGWIRDGYTVTESDLRDAISDSGDLQSFDEGRRWLHTGRTWLWAVWLIPFALLLGIGLLGGRSWPSRLTWALAVLFFAALAFYAITGVVYSTVGKSGIEDGVFDVAAYERTASVAAAKGNEIAEDSLDSYVSGMRGKALVIAIGSAAGLAGAIVWSRRRVYESQEPTETIP